MGAAQRAVEIPIMRGPRTIRALEEMCRHMGPTTNATMAEIGCFAGESTAVWARFFKKVYAIDPWIPGYDDANDTGSKVVGSEVEALFDQRMHDYPNVIKIKNHSYNVADSLFDDGTLDFVYIDAEHTYSGVKKDLLKFIPKIRSGGFIGGHDYKPRFQGCVDAVNEFFGTPDRLFDDTSWIVQLTEERCQFRFG